MGKKHKRNPECIPNGKTSDVSLHSTEIISNNTNKVHELAMVDVRFRLPVKGESALQIETDRAEMGSMQKKLKRENIWRDPLENENIYQNPVAPCDVSKEQYSDATLQNNETVSAIKDKLHASTFQSIENPAFTPNGSLGTVSQTADNHAEACPSQEVKKKRRKKKKTKADDDKSNNTDDKPLESGELCCPNVTNSKQPEKEISCSEILTESMTCKKNQEVFSNDSLTASVLRSLSHNANTSSAKERELSTETCNNHVDVQNLKTYHRKVKRLYSSEGNVLETRKNGGPSTSLQVVKNSLMDKVTRGEHALIFDGKEGNMKDGDESNLIQRVSESGVLVELSPKLSSKSMLQKVEVGPGSSVVHKSSIGDVSVTGADNELVLRESKRNTNITHEDGASKDMSRWCTCDDQIIMENECKLDKVQKTAQELRFSVEICKEELAADCKNTVAQTQSDDLRRLSREVKSIHEGKSSDNTSTCSTMQPEYLRVDFGFGEGIPKVEAKEDGIIIKDDDPSEFFSEEGCSSSGSDKRTSHKRSRSWEEKANPTVNKYKASKNISVCSPKKLHHPIEHNYENVVVDRSFDFAGNCPEVDASCVISKENFERSFSKCYAEESTPSHVDPILLGVPYKEDRLLESSIAPQRAPVSDTTRKLLILDLNGLLADIVTYVPNGYKADKIISQKALFKRPFCDDFLRFCFERFNVGVWSSRVKTNVDKVVDFLMGEMRHKLLFCWDQSHCTKTRFSTIENRNKPLVLKDLKKLWDKHESNLPWEKGEYNELNTLLLDDSPYKALRNPPCTAVFPKTYRFRDRRNDTSLGQGGDLRVYLEELATTDNVQKFVKEHPFGQRPITSANASWAFYEKVIRSTD